MHVLSNAGVYLAIAHEAHDAMRRSLESERRPKPDGSDGFIIAYSPGRVSFKQSLICIAFCGMYFEALVYVSARKRRSKTWANSIDRLPYKQRLVKLGISCPNLHSQAQDLQNARRDLVHEKAAAIEELDDHRIWVAQDVATEVLTFVRHLEAVIETASTT